MKVFELNIDGLVGPTHNYAGLAVGNLASKENAFLRANPKAAALQGLKKMRLLHSLGLKQAVFPPHERPNLNLLKQLGFQGSASGLLKQAAKHIELLSACYSASSMWAANAATVSSSLDCKDKRVHFTAANLVSNLHRHQEAAFSKLLLETIFKNEQHFQHHEILPRSLITGDEGAANHSRIAASHSKPGLSLFVYGKEGLKIEQPLIFPARQTLEASRSIADSHLLSESKVIFAKQNPEVIDQGVFHNDVIAVANESLIFLHEYAFYRQKAVIAELESKADFHLSVIEVKNQELSVNEAVSTYIFNSQLLSLENKEMVLIAPVECQNSSAVQIVLQKIISSKANPISKVFYLDLKQSMQNGGGPACLRLRVPLNEEEFKAMHKGVIVDTALLDKLEIWIKKHYRSSLDAKDLVDPSLIDEVYRALDELTVLLSLPPIYPFQRF